MLHEDQNKVEQRESETKKLFWQVFNKCSKTDVPTSNRNVH